MKLKNISPLPFIVHDGDGLGGVVNEPLKEKEEMLRLIMMCQRSKKISWEIVPHAMCVKIKSTDPMRVVIKISTSLSS